MGMSYYEYQNSQKGLGDQFKFGVSIGTTFMSWSRDGVITTIGVIGGLGNDFGWFDGTYNAINRDPSIPTQTYLFSLQSGMRVF